MGYESTHDRADRMIGEARRTLREQEEAAAQKPDIAALHKAGYGYAVEALETCAINLRAVRRGMVAVDMIPHYVKHAREALDRIEQALVR